MTVSRGLWVLAATTVTGVAAAAQTSSVPQVQAQGVRVSSVQYRADGQTISSLGEGLPQQPTAVPRPQADGGVEVPPNMLAVPDASGLTLLTVPPSNPARPSAAADSGGIRTMPAMAMGAPMVDTAAPVQKEAPKQPARGGLRLLPPTAQNTAVSTQAGTGEGIPELGDGLPPIQPVAPEPMIQPGYAPEPGGPRQNAQDFAPTDTIPALGTNVVPQPQQALAPEPMIQPGYVPMPGGATETTQDATAVDAIPAMGNNIVPPKQDAPLASVQPRGVNLPGPTYDPLAPIQEVQQVPLDVQGADSIPAMNGNIALPQAKSVSMDELDAALHKSGSRPVRPASAAEIEQGKNPAANGPVNVPGWGPALRMREINMPGDGSCQSVRPGDRVHFSLRVENAQDARHIFTHIVLGLGEHPKLRMVGFVPVGANTLGGGGVGQQDPNDAQVYHFSFLVPLVESGIYHTAGIDVRATYGVARSAADPGVAVPLDRHSREQVKVYCLAVFGGYGSGGHNPIVTEFNADPVEHAAAPIDQPVFSQPFKSY